METKIELVPGTRVTIETNSDGSTITMYEEETPSYQFKDGDFVRSTSDCGNEWIYIYKCIDEEDIIIYHALYDIFLKQISGYNRCGIGGSKNQVDSRLCTEEEKQKIIDALEKDGKKWDAENKCIVDIQPKFKDGDFIYTEYNNEKCIGILKGDYKGYDQPIDLYCVMSSIICIAGNFRIEAERKRHDRLATGSEMQEIVKFLENRGLFWNPVLKKVEKIKWKPKSGEKYYYVSNIGSSFETDYEEDSICDKTRISIGNFFQTEVQVRDAIGRVNKLFAEIQAEIYK